MPPPGSSREWADPAMVGRKLKLDRPIVSGHGEIEYGGRVWKAVAREDLDSGTKVRIVGVDGNIVKLEKA
jgi:membrane protein implicated in regulation of membrane protease activity